MIGTRVTRRYAKALFELAEEQKLLPEVEHDLISIKRISESSEEFGLILESPVIDVAEKKAVFARLFKDSVHPVTYRFLELLIEKNREDLLPVIIDRFLNLLDEARGIVRGQLFTAYPFTEQQLTALTRRLNKITGKEVVLHQSVKPELLGGFVIQMNDTVIDTSLKNQLNKLRERLVYGE